MDYHRLFVLVFLFLVTFVPLDVFHTMAIEKTIYVSLERPTIFKLVGSHSGAFWADGGYGILDKYASTDPSLNFKLWFSAGTYESGIYQDTSTMVSHCISKGWTTEVVYLFEGHSWGSWRHTLNDMLEYFFPYRQINSTEPSTYFTMTALSQQTSSFSILGIFPYLLMLIIWIRRKRKHRE